MIQDILQRAAASPRLRYARPHDADERLPYFRIQEERGGPAVRLDGAERVMLGSSNYLGLNGDPRVTQAAEEALRTYGTAMNGSRVMNGTTPLHLRLEEEVADWMGEAAALLYPSGYDANVGCISALLSPGDAVVCDAGDHASILDGVRLSGARFLPFQHNRMDRFRAMLDRAIAHGGGVLVVVDGIYSMEGDVARLPELVQLCTERRVPLLVDEAHAVGVLGPQGTGSCAALGIDGDVDLRMGTFSKALAACGGFITGPTDAIDFLRVQSRAFLFTAATAPASVAAALASLEIVRSQEGAQRAQQLLSNAGYLRRGLAELGFEAREPLRLDSGQELPTPIIAVPVGDDELTATMWRSLYDKGVYVNAALHPAVPQGRAQLRLAVMATHTRDHLDHALDAFGKLRVEFPATAAPEGE
ncbi:aminotransferase class I/II-fold pyridoxal phosphate-dependent enzyme [Streptomyces polyrhachis]|uniref:8-amino-7-oxononanoate synthase n=1 Tax=Streptomyces polyrhachis TaxID=1282885 RepID=A0ABW2GIR3_9ACTN